MRRVSIWLVILFLISIGSGYLSYSNQKTVSSETITSGQIRATKIALSTEQTSEILNVAPSDMPKVLSKAYRLRPDKRFLLAIQEVYSFFLPGVKEKVTAKFLEGQWVIISGKMEVGRVPEFPEFSDFLNLISISSNKLNREFPQNLTDQNSPQIYLSIKGELSKFLAPNATIALQKINAMWAKGNHDPQLLKLATQGLIGTALQGSDQLEISDPVHAKALAVLGITQSLTSISMKREEALLAWIMDYSGHAVKVAKLLDESDPLGMFIMKNDSSLKKLAWSDESSTEAKYLWLLRLAQLRKMEDWYTWLLTAFGDIPLTISVLKTGLELKSFVGSRHFTKEIQQIAILELSSERDRHSGQDISQLAIEALLKNNQYYQILNTVLELESVTGSRIARFESELKTVGKNYAGPFLDAKTYSSYYRGHFYSSLFIEARHYLDTLSDINGAKQLSNEMKGKFYKIEKKFAAIKNEIGSLLASNAASNSEIGKWVRKVWMNYLVGSTASIELLVWYDNLIAAKAGEKNIEDLKFDLLTISELGVPALFQTYRATVINYSGMDPAVLLLAKHFVSRLDSRNKHKSLFGNIAIAHLNDLKVAEKLYRSVEASSPSNYVDILITNAYRSGDDKKLFKHLQSPHMSSDDKSDILFQLYFLHPNSRSAIEKEYRRFIKEDPEDWGLTNGYAGFLMRKKDFVQARKLIRNWQKLELVTPGLERINAQTKLARTYYEEGRYQDAWTEIAKVVEGQAGSSLRLAGKVLNKLGRLEDAEIIFRFNHKRYPSSISNLMPLIGFLWEHDRALEAAKLLKGFKGAISGKDWKSEIAQPFLEIFSSQPVEKGEEAFSQLIKAGMSSMHLMEMTPVIFENGKEELAFKMQAQLRWGGYGQVLLHFKAYPYLKKWQGEKKALEWLRKVIPTQFASHTSDMILSTKEFDLLWNFIKSPDEYGWMVRATAYLSDKNLSEKNKSQLFKHFNSPSKDQNYNIVGRYMLGMVTEQELLNAADTPKKRCEYAYFIGYKAQVEGNLEKASDWYRVVMETGQHRNGEYHMAVNQLVSWQEQFRYLSHLKPAQS